MGFFFRKGVKFGPLRFNFSKSGVGVSAGVRGARVSAGPRGTYINVGRNGFYYRQKIHIPAAQPQGRPYGDPHQGFGTPPPRRSGVDYTESIGSDSFTDTTLENTLSEINAKLNTPARAPIAVTLIILLGVALLLGSAFSGVMMSEVFARPLPGDEQLIPKLYWIAWACGVGAVAVMFGGVFLMRSLRKRDKLRRTARLFYEFDGAARDRYNKVLRSVEALAQSSSLWSQQTRQATYDWKRNAGAGTLVTRRPITVGRFEPPALETNVPICGLNFGQWQLFFMPDNIFVLSGNRYHAYPYQSVRKSLSDTRFVEDGQLPPDAAVVDYTWLRVNKDGSPDRRFSYNRRLPVARYGVLEFTSDSGLHIHLQVSSLQRALEFASLWNDAFSSSESDERKSFVGRSERLDGTEANVNGKSAREILGVSRGASLEDVNAAYREKAKQYHPDRVEGLGPELKALADEKMKEVNAAYAALKKQFVREAKAKADVPEAGVSGQGSEVGSGNEPTQIGYVPHLSTIQLRHGSNLAAWVFGAALSFGIMLIFFTATTQFLDARMRVTVRNKSATNINVSSNVNTNTNVPRASKKSQNKLPNTNKNTAAQNGNAASDVYLIPPAEESAVQSAVDYGRVFKMSEVTRPASITFKPEPGYTVEARKNNVAGVVRLRAVLSATGEVTNITVVKELPDGLTEKAVSAAKQIHFMPAQKDGHPVSQYVVLEYNFNIY